MYYLVVTPDGSKAKVKESTFNEIIKSEKGAKVHEIKRSKDIVKRDSTGKIESIVKEDFVIGYVCNL